MVRAHGYGQEPMTEGFAAVLGVALPLTVGVAKALPMVTTMSVNWLLVAVAGAIVTGALVTGCFRSLHLICTLPR